jgi:hypothetical protein
MPSAFVILLGFCTLAVLNQKIRPRPGRRNSISQPSQSSGRCVQPYPSQIQMKHYENLSETLSKNIKKLCNKHDLSLWKKLKKESNKTVFYSLLVEAHFGLFFDQQCSLLKYNHKIFQNNKLTPDFVISQNGQEIVVDVFRINPAKEDQKIIDAQDIAIDKYRSKNPGVPFWTNAQLLTIKPDKLFGNNSSLINKAKKYGPFVEKENQPFLICLYFDFLSGHDALDLYHCLYGNSIEFIEEINCEEYKVQSNYFDLSNALYYSNKHMENVSGVILRTNENEFIYFHNFSIQNRLNTKNINWFLNFQCKEGDNRR